ncbi:hypothetical protein [Acidovorax sp.]|uniref:hypothetical protein n=1 Tax=Acidovorax sp. TaxID=1872122 RepID=UPI0027B9C0FC|nr:hypothetical protein [Acidovorax sp.]
MPLSLLAGLCQAQAIDRITVGHTLEPVAIRTMQSVVAATGDGARVELRPGGDYGTQAVVARAFHAPLGELQANVAMIATATGKATYARYVIRRENLPAALNLLKARWPSHVKVASDEAGINDVFFVSPLNAAWVHLGTGTEFFGEVVVTTHSKLREILAAQNRIDDWWPEIEEAIAKSARSTSK